MSYLNKIHILLPHKENFSYEYPGAVSLYVKEFLEYSIYHSKINIFGLENKGKKLHPNFIPIKKVFFPLFSNTNFYLNSYIRLTINNYPDIVEVHNRPSYIATLSTKLKSKLILFYHNDPNEMRGSKTIKEKKFLLEKCEIIIFISNYVKNCFFKDIDESLYKSKFKIIYHSTKNLINFPQKKKLITYVGKLNYAKGYDIFGNSITKILNKFPEYKSIAIGDEKRRKIYFKHKNFRELGFLKNSEVIKILKKTDIAIVPSRWNEPFGRTALEATKCGCYTISSYSGGLPETSDFAVFIKNINHTKLYNAMLYAIENDKIKKKIQLQGFQNVKHIIKKNTLILDSLRRKIIDSSILNSKKIINIYNTGIKSSHRLYNISLGHKFTTGFIKNGYDVLEISDRDYDKSLFYSQNFRDYLLNSIFNYQPKFVFFGHSKLLNSNILSEIKNKFPNIIICEWNEDYLGPYGPDSYKNFINLKSKEKYVDYFFITTNPKKIIKKLKNSFYIPIPVDKNIESEKQFQKVNDIDLFFTMSHGVNRGVLKKNKKDERDKTLQKILSNKKISCNFFGFKNKQPIWANKFFDEIKKCNMGLNLSRGKPINLYSSNRIASYIGNGLLTFIDAKAGFQKFFNKNEVVFYNNINDLIKKIFFYKSNDNLRKKIAKNGYYKYHTIFNNYKVCKQILKIINTPKIN